MGRGYFEGCILRGIERGILRRILRENFEGGDFEVVDFEGGLRGEDFEKRF